MWMMYGEFSWIVHCHVWLPEGCQRYWWYFSLIEFGAFGKGARVQAAADPEVIPNASMWEYETETFRAWMLSAVFRFEAFLRPLNIMVTVTPMINNYA